jgi:hypothetical protein
MTALHHQSFPEAGTFSWERLSPAETALYTRDLLENLRKVAEKQGQGLLAHLLEMASREAKFQGAQTQQTRLPG